MKRDYIDQIIQISEIQYRFTSFSFFKMCVTYMGNSIPTEDRLWKNYRKQFRDIQALVFQEQKGT